MISSQKNDFPLKSFLYLATDRMSGLSPSALKDFDPRKLSLRNNDYQPDVRVSLVRLPHLDICSVAYGCNMRAELEQPLDSYNLVLPISGSLRDNSNYTIATANKNSFLFSPGEQSDLDWSHDCTSLILRIQPQELQQFCERVYGVSLNNILQLPKQIEHQSSAGYSLANTLKMMVRELDQEDSLFSQGITTKSITELILSSIINLNPISPKEYKTSRGNDQNLNKVLEYIENNLDREILLSDIAASSDLKMRKLQSIFSKKFGMGPMTYIKQEKLNRIRQALLSANPNEAKVADIAADWGFYHHSNFTLLYKKHFGETPSETLNGNKKLIIPVAYTL